MPYWAYVSNDGSNEIQVIDLSTAEEIHRISVPPGPFGMALTPDGQQLWAPLDVARTVGIIDTGTGKLFRQIDLPDSDLLDVAIHPEGGEAYILSGSGVLYRLDTATAELTGVVGLGGDQPERLALCPNGRQIWIADEGNGTVTVVDTERFKVAARLALSEAAADVAFTADGHLALVPDLHGGQLHLIDCGSHGIFQSIELEGGMPRSVALAPQDDLAYVTLYHSDQVLMVDLVDGVVAGTLQGCFDGPNGLAVTPDGNLAVVVSQMSSAVCLIDLQTGQEAKQIPFPGTPRRVVIAERPPIVRMAEPEGGNGP